ncbi:NALCN channel auxiliary factor 2-like [Ylistrum balloti]|uniref:NALCN channel auxiliary factor 2-like n=1 Tax=Ylistrum balloti TaxID=509963 RepID=UPI00290593CA|nr:NALCN channel auxiliary factor 2-like [Ylistrum balloti]
MTLGHVASSLYEKPSSPYKNTFNPRSIVTTCLLLLIWFVHGCLNILHSESKLLSHPSTSLCEIRNDGESSSSSIVNRSQCLDLNSQFSESICNISETHRTQEIRKYRLNFCKEYSVFSVIPNKDIVNEIEHTGCLNYLQKIILLDQEVENMYEEFKQIMFKFDCSRTQYSVKWTCVDCEVAYRKWLCSLHIDYYHACYFDRDIPVPPCQDMCMEVERKCPFFRPNTSYAQAGDPSFICKDRDIFKEEPFSNCYKDCHLRPNDCEFPCKLEETTVSSSSTLLNESTDSSKITPRSNSSERLALQQTPTLVNIVLFVLNLCIVRTLLQYMSIGWT